ncbi:MAG: hypothetical protein ABIQ27_02880, partial [Flavobacterium sp.]
MKKSTLLQFLGFPCCDSYDVTQGESGLKLDFSKSNTTDCCCPDNRGSIKSKGMISIIMLFVLFLFSNISSAQITLDGDPSDWFNTLALPGGIKARIIDPTNPSDDIWQGGGSKDINPISSWGWQTNSSNDKNNIANGGYYLDGNILYFFADRYSNNGDSAIGFWLLQGSVAKLVNGSFSGDHTDGDILMISHFVNGGSVAQIQAFRWDGGANGTLNPTPIPLPTSGLDARVNSTVVNSPLAWGYTPKAGAANTYPENSFFEGFIDLTSINFNLSVCLGTFIIETRQSQSLNSTLEDFAGGRFGSVPLDKTLIGGSYCSSSPNTGTITMASSETGVSYQLVLDSDSSNVQAAQLGTGGTLTWSGLPAGSYHVLATNTTSLCTAVIGLPTIVTVVNSPTCSITGIDSVCPSTTSIGYSGPAGAGLTYAWSIVGNGTISGVANQQNVTVNAGSVCGQTFTLTLILSNAANCSSTCTKIVTVNDTTPPQITFCPPGAALGCNPAGVPAAGVATATDNCSTPSITSALGAVSSDGCGRSQTRTYTATDACGNSSTCTQLFTWTADTTAPEFTFCPPGAALGCNPAGGVPAAGVAIATDACGTPSITSALGAVSSDGCGRSQTRTYTATDACGNSSTCTQLFTWTVDTTAPEFTFCPPGAALGCNPAGVPAAGVAIATDACGTPSITSALGAVSSNGCSRSQTRTYT